MKLALVKSDVVGALASTLCLIHCLITPIIFIAHTCSITCCAESPVWWKTLDYVFLIISFFAVAYSVKNSTGNIIKPLLWTCWVSLLLLVTNEDLQWFSIPENVTYVASILLAVVHVYNLKFCQCKSTECCAHK